VRACELCTLILEKKDIRKLHSRCKVWGIVDWVDIHAFGGGHPAMNIVSKLVETICVELTLIPTLRRLRSVLRMVDMALVVQWLLKLQNDRRGTLTLNLEAGLGSPISY
jgi:hypothetical protein